MYHGTSEDALAGIQKRGIEAQRADNPYSGEDEPDEIKAAWLTKSKKNALWWAKNARRFDKPVAVEVKVSKGSVKGPYGSMGHYYSQESISPDRVIKVHKK